MGLKSDRVWFMDGPATIQALGRTDPGIKILKQAVFILTAEQPRPQLPSSNYS